MHRSIGALSAIVMAASAFAGLTTCVAFAQQTPGAITGGASNVTVDGKPAARVGDQTTDGKIVEGSSNVFINGKPAAVLGGRTDCGGTTITGSNGVFINGKPMARQGDATSGCPGK